MEEIIIVGAGVAGLSAALEPAQNGISLSVTSCPFVRLRVRRPARDSHSGEDARRKADGAGRPAPAGWPLRPRQGSGRCAVSG